MAEQEPKKSLLKENVLSEEYRHIVIQAGIDAVEGIPDLTGMMFFLFLALAEKIQGYSHDRFDEDEFLPFELKYLKTHPREAEGEFEFYISERDRLDYTESLNLIFCNALVTDFYLGRSGAKEMLIALFQYYYREKFNRLKKYKSVNGLILNRDDFVFHLPDDPSSFDILTESADYALIVTMCMCLGIEVSKEIWYAINLLNSQKDNFTESINKIAVEQEKKNLTYLMDEKKRRTHNRKVDRVLSSLETFNLKHPYSWPESRKALKIIDFQVFISSLESNKMDPHEPKEEADSNISDLILSGIDVDKLKPSELAAYASFNWYLSLLMEQIIGRDRIIHNLIYKDGRPINDYSEPIQLNIKETSSPSVRQTTVTEQVIKEEKLTFDESAYIEEISRLRNRLQITENAVQKQRELYEQEKGKVKQLEEKASRFEAEQNELIALRDFAYIMAEEDLPEERNVSREEMLRYLNSRHAVLIGGHDHWVNKLKELFPKWRFADAEDQASIPVTILENADMAFIFTGYLGHSQYNRHMEYIREKKVPFAYVSQVNIDTNIRQFYRLLKEQEI